MQSKNPSILTQNLNENVKTYTEELREKESSYGKIFKVSGPRINTHHIVVVA
jgi:hypothetical protein